jgi:leucyl aminopeptidase (aminopeptidase T)
METVDRTHQRALLEADYSAIARKQAEFEAALRRGETRVTTPLGTDISFRIGDRAVTKQDGDASLKRSQSARVLIDREVELPCGAIRVAPIEESVSGVVVFPPAQWNGQDTSAVALHFEKGKVVKIEPQGDEADIEAVEAELEAGGDAARSFREFALGFNPLLAVPEQDPWIPYYGYGAGVVRLSLGDNSELGGQVRGPYVRWNFFIEATVNVDGEVWVEGGNLQ